MTPLLVSQIKSVLNNVFRKIIKSYNVANECIVFFTRSVPDARIEKNNYSEHTICRLFEKKYQRRIGNCELTELCCADDNIFCCISTFLLFGQPPIVT